MKKVALFLMAVVLSSNAWSEGDVRSAVQNPISAMISLPFKLNLDYGADNGDATILNIQPVIPVTVGKWNLVNRAIIPLAHVDGAIQGPNNPSPQAGGSASGLGDINYSLYFSPVDYGKVIWGVGPSLNMKTATKDELGSGKWSAGPTAVALTQPDWGTMGVLGRQLWSFAGDSDREDVNQFLLEPFVNYNLDNGWYLISGHDHYGQLGCAFQPALDGTDRGRRREDLQDRQPDDKLAPGSLLQCGKPGCRAGLEYCLYLPVPVSEVK